MMQSSYGEELGVGEKIAGRYEVLSVLGKGSMGVVYKARHDILGRIVAIKTLRLQRIVDDRSAKRFEREAKVACMVEHQNIIKVFDFGYTGDGVPYLVMDYVSGIPLYNVLKEERAITADRAVVLFSQVCDGLYHAHQRGVIHRDLKPANIMVVKKEHEPESVRIVDLGVAKIVAGSEGDEAEAITRTGEVCGSPIYLSPEQCVYQELDPRTDIYSLGVCLYESLTGLPPLRGNTVYDTIYMHVNEIPRPFKAVAPDLDIPPRVEEIVLRCLAKRPCDRFETMQELKQELIAALRGASAPAINVLSPDQLFGRQRKPGEGGSKGTGPHTPVPGAELPRPGDAVADGPGRKESHTPDYSRPDSLESARIEPRDLARAGKQPTRESDRVGKQPTRESDRIGKNADSGRLGKASITSPDKVKNRPGLADTISQRIYQADPVWRIVGIAGVLFGIGALIYAFYITQSVESRLREQGMRNTPATPAAVAHPPHAATKPPKSGSNGSKPKNKTQPKVSKGDEPTKPKVAVKGDEGVKPTKVAKEDTKAVKSARNDDNGNKKSPGKKGIQDGTQDMALSGMEMVPPGSKNGETKSPKSGEGEQALPALSLPDLFSPRKPAEKKVVPPQEAPPKVAQSLPGRKPVGPPGLKPLQPMEAKMDNRGSQPEGGENTQPPPSQPQQPVLSAASRDAELAETFYRTGRQEFGAHDIPAAIKAFENAYSRFPSDAYKLSLAAALTEGAASCNRNHQYTMAVSYQNRACELYPNNEKYQTNLAGYKSNLQRNGSY